MPSQSLNSLNIADFPLFCIYALIDEENKLVYVQYSNGNALCKLTTSLTQLKRGIHDIRALQDAFNRGSLTIKVLEQYTSSREEIYLIARCHFLTVESGYTDLGSYSKMRYTVKTTIAQDYDQLRHRVPLVYVSIQPSCLNAIVIGIFETLLDAEAYINSVYPDGKVDKLQICSSELTLGYYKKHGFKLQKFKETVSNYPA